MSWLIPRRATSAQFRTRCKNHEVQCSEHRSETRHCSVDLHGFHNSGPTGRSVMSDPLFLAAVFGLGLSAIASAIRLIDWFIHSDPKVIAQTGRWAGVGIATLSVPLLIGLLLSQRWTAASALAAVMLLAFAFYGPRALAQLIPRRLRPDWSPRAADGAATGFDPAPPSPELVQRSIAILEDYLHHTTGIPKHNGKDVHAVGALPSDDNARRNGGGKGGEHAPGAMSSAEALDVLGLPPDATEWQINDTHRRLVQLVHPDRGGSHYLAVKINQAKEVLLGEASLRAQPDAASPPPKPSRRRPVRRQQP
jgi:hypothetical protein